LTQWIFKSDFCCCDQVLLRERYDVTVRIAKLVSTVSVEEDELPLSPESFPMDRYKPLKKVGEGSAGTVYLCRDRLLRKKVAIKVLKSVTPEQMIEFQNEARTTAKMDHESIVRILDFGATPDTTPFMVMEFIAGQTLKRSISRGGVFEPEAAVRLFVQVADAMSYAHSLKIMHRDLQTNNILIIDRQSKSPGIRVVDFGLAKIRAEQEPTIINGNTIVGTPLYMSPDQFNGLPFDARSEVYSLGCIMFEALTGKPPFVGPSAMETIGMHAREKAPSIKEFLADSKTVDGLAQVVAKCLAKSPLLRYQNMDELSAALSALVEKEQPRAARFEAEPQLKLSLKIPAVLDKPALEIEDLPSLSRFPVKAVLIGASALIAVGVCAFTLMILASVKQPTVLHPVKSNAVKESVLLINPSHDPILPERPEDKLVFFNLMGRLSSRMNQGPGQLWALSHDNSKRVSPEVLLKEAEIADITHVWLSKQNLDDDLENLQGLPLKTVCVADSPIGNAGMKTLSQIGTVETVFLFKSARITVDGIKELRHLPRLQNLIILDGVNVDRKRLHEVLDVMPNLKALDFGGTYGFSPEFWQSLKKETKLERLTMGTGVPAKNLCSALAGKNIVDLRIPGLSYTKEDMQQLARLPLQTLIVPAAVPENLSPLNNCKTLVRLVVVGENDPELVTKVQKAVPKRPVFPLKNSDFLYTL